MLLDFSSAKKVYPHELCILSSKVKTIGVKGFQRISGLQINTTKTEEVWLGKWKDRTDEPFGWKWPKDPSNAFGVFFPYNQGSAKGLTSVEKILNLKKTLNTWQQRNLTLYGEINIVKTLWISKLIY